MGVSLGLRFQWQQEGQRKKFPPRLKLRLKLSMDEAAMPGDKADDLYYSLLRTFVFLFSLLFLLRLP
jgi:hypothetical protein